MEEVFNAIGALIKAILFLIIAVVLLIVACLCYACCAIGLPLDLLVLVLSGGRGGFEVTNTFIRAGNTCLKGLLSFGKEYYGDGPDKPNA